MEEHIIREVKEFINKGHLQGLKELWEQYQTLETVIAWDYVFQKVYLHACLKRKTDIVEWLHTLFSKLGIIEQIGIKHTLVYGKYLLKK